MTSDFQAQLHAWQAFYMLCGGAAATLAGLLFVGLTFGSGLFGRTPDPEKVIHIWAEPILQDFLTVLLVSALTLVPVLSAGWLAFLLLLASLRKVRHLVEVGLHLRAMGPDSDLEFPDWALQLWLPSLACLLEVAAAVGLAVGQGWACWRWAPASCFSWGSASKTLGPNWYGWPWNGKNQAEQDQPQGERHARASPHHRPLVRHRLPLVLDR